MKNCRWLKSYWSVSHSLAFSSYYRLKDFCLFFYFAENWGLITVTLNTDSSFHILIFNFTITLTFTLTSCTVCVLLQVLQWHFIDRVPINLLFFFSFFLFLISFTFSESSDVLKCFLNTIPNTQVTLLWHKPEEKEPSVTFLITWILVNIPIWWINLIASSVGGVFNGELLLLGLPSQAHDVAVREQGWMGQSIDRTDREAQLCCCAEQVILSDRSTGAEHTASHLICFLIWSLLHTCNFTSFFTLYRSQCRILSLP